MDTLFPLIRADALRERLARGERLLLCDCRFDLSDTALGERAYVAGHLPGAAYLHLDRDLSGAKTGRNGRHPLPDPATLAARFAALGADDDTPVVAYDASGGMFAARAWWLLRWLGHGAVQVLDGGVPAWRAAGGALETGLPPAAAPGRFSARGPAQPTQHFSALLDGLGRGTRLIVDARAADRFRGENETLDPKGGHIPGALNRPFRDNLGPDGCFKPMPQLHAEWQALLAGRAPADVVHQCGSGVTACHNLLAMAVAGLPGGALYAGSWSEWCRDPARPVAQG